MTYSRKSFETFCFDAAKRFLQTVVVIDNEACLTQAELVHPEIPVEVNEPLPSSIKSKKDTETQSDESEEQHQSDESVDRSQDDSAQSEVIRDDSRVLYAKPLIDQFADNGTVCSVIRPEEKETNIIERCISVASAADIVVIDWELGHEKGESKSARVKEVIKGILKRDIQNKGRLRVIAVYTAEEALDALLTELYDHIGDLKFPFGKIKKDRENFCVGNSHLKIIFFNKPGVSKHVPDSRIVDFKELPTVLMKKFSEMNCGLLPTVALESIAAIRKDTHHLLAIMHNGLDGALVTHRSLLPYPDDAEDFCIGLVADELFSILENNEVGSKQAGEIANKLWVGANCKPESFFNFKSFRLSREQAFNLVEKGQSNHKSTLAALRTDWLEQKLKENPQFADIDGNLIIVDTAKTQVESGDRSALKKYKIQDISEMAIPNFYYSSKGKSRDANLEFSRLCSLKREAYGIRQPISGWIPHLSLGTIVRCFENAENEVYYLCLQPKCDSVRLQKGNVYGFPFLPLRKNKKKFNSVLLTNDDNGKLTTKKLHYEAKPRNLTMFQFKCDTGHSIKSVPEADTLIFMDVDNNRFEWIADVKDMIAQKIADELSTQAGRVGLDEYEWLRRNSR